MLPGTPEDNRYPTSIAVVDPFGVASDPAMPSLAIALDPAEAEQQFLIRLPHLPGPQGTMRLREIRVTRYKPSRRCVIEYGLDLERKGVPAESLTLIGKVRVQRFGKSGFRLLHAFWNAGFRADNEDGISVPEPIGTVSKFRMWLQRKVPGQVATDLLMTPGSEALVCRIAEAAFKLHQAGVPAERRHTIADELRILREHLAKVAFVKPVWAARIARLLLACERLGAAMPQPLYCGSHRDFYSDQIIVDTARLYLIDFDLYCEADPSLDIGNFVGHITEHSLRFLGDPKALAHLEQTMEERFAALAGTAVRYAVRAYATLTLVRHIYLSTLFPERRAFTACLLDLCEERLGRASGIYHLSSCKERRKGMR